MTLADYTVKGVSRDMAAADFLAVLRAAGSPVRDDQALEVYSYALSRSLSPAFLLAMFHHESTYGRFGSATTTHSWGNTRPPSFGAPQTGVSDRFFSIYADWIDGGISTVARLFDHKPYDGLVTVRQIIRVWAPPVENTTERYIDAVLADIEQWTGGDAVAVPKPPLKSKPSPNCGYEGDYRPEAIVWHITAGSGQSALSWLTNPNSGASANYLNMEDGAIWELVNPENGRKGAAWANGKVNKPNLSNAPVRSWITAGINPNRRTISIENAGQTSAGKGGSLTDKQVPALIALTAYLCDRWGIPPTREYIIPHAYIDSVDRPNCPGFSEAEWNTWVSRVALLVKGDGGGGEDVREPAAGNFDTYLNGKGETILVINYGGQATSVEGFVIVDAGVSVKNAAGEIFDRSVKANVIEPWQGPR